MSQRPSRPVLDLTPAGRAVVVLASLALGAAWTTGSEPARVAACLLLAPLLVDWVAKLRRLHGVTIAVTPRRTRAGAALLDRVTLTNRSRASLWHTQLSEHGLLATVRGQPMHIEHTPRLSVTAVELRLRARARGVVATRTFVLSTQHPFGLVRLSAPLLATTKVIVEPARIALPVPLAVHGQLGAEQRQAQQGSHDDAFYALRELRAGEDFARVHALRSAALGTPVRVLRRGAAQHSARMLLDLRAAPGRLPQRYQDQAFEWALSAATTLLEELARAGRTCDLVVLGATSTSFAGIGERTAPHTVFAHFATLRPHRYTPTPAATLAWMAAGAGDVFWVTGSGFLATGERERAGSRLQLVEWVA
jgi:hypothetical protein